MHTYKVVVGSVGTVHAGHNGLIALKWFKEYVKISKQPHGRAASENVTLFRDGEILKEYTAPTEDVIITATINHL